MTVRGELPRLLERAALGAGLLAGADLFVMLDRGARVTPAAAGLVLALDVLASAAAAAVLAALRRLPPWIEGKVAVPHGLFRAAMLLLCAAPVLVLGARAEGAAVRLASIAVSCVGLVLLLERRAVRTRSRAGLLLGAGVAAAVFFAATRSVNVVLLLSSGAPWLRPLVALFPVALFGAAFVYRVVEDAAATGGFSARERVGLLVIAGLYLVSPAVTITGLYPAAHAASQAAALYFIDVALAGVRLRRAAPAGAALLAGAVAAAVWIATAGAVGPAVAAVARHAALASQVLRRMPITRPGFEAYVAGLARRHLDPAEAESAPAPGLASARSALLITVDTLRDDHVGRGAGTERAVTPALDELAATGVRFRRAYANGGYTSLSLPGLLWSLHPGSMPLVPLSETTQLIEALPPGKLTRGAFLSPRGITSRNVAEAVGDRVETVAIVDDGDTAYFHPSTGFTRGFRRVIVVDDRAAGTGGVADAAVADRAIAEIEGLRGRRFLLWLHFYGPHGGARPYAERVRHTDSQIGRLLRAMARGGDLETTAILVTSDHGEGLGEHGHRFHGNTLFEEMVRVPLLLRAPGLRPGSVGEPVALVDVAPTLLALLGRPPEPGFEGRSLLPFAERSGAPSQHSPSASGARPVFLETWRRNPLTAAEEVSLAGAVAGTRKVVLDRLLHTVAFYDLHADPGESAPLDLDDRPDRAAFEDLAARLVQRGRGPLGVEAR